MASRTSAAATRRLVMPLSLILGFAVAICFHPEGECHEQSTGDLSPAPAPHPGGGEGREGFCEPHLSDQGILDEWKSTIFQSPLRFT